MTTAADASGNGHTGTYTNSPTLGVTGLQTSDSDTAVSFNAASLQSVDGDDTFNGTIATWTLEAIVKATSWTLGPHISGFTDLSVDNLALLVDPGGAVIAAFDGSGGSHQVSGGTLSTGTTYHLVAKYDSTNLKVFIDGVQAATAAVSDSAVLTTQAFMAGNDPFGDAFDGVLDEVAFYQTALSNARITAHVAAMTSGYAAAVLADSPALYWRLGETAAVVSGNPALPTLSLSAELGGSAGQEDLTDYGVEPAFNIQRGTTSPTQTGTVADAGTLSTLLDNISRDLDPNNALSPFVGFLRPKAATVAAATWGPTDYTLLTGRVDDWPQSYPSSGTEQYVDFRATDLFNYLANTPINTVRPAEKTGARFQAVLDAIEYPGPTSIDPGMSAVCAQDLQTVAALGHLGDLAQVEYGETGIDADGVLYFRDRRSIATDTRSTVVQAEYVQTGGLNFIDITMGSPNIINYVTLTYGKNGKQLTVRDQPSIDDFDLQATSVSLPFQTFSQAKVFGLWLLFLYAQPRTTFTSVTFQPYNEPGDTFDLWADLLGRKEGDLVQITLDPLIAPGTVSGDPIVRQQWVRGINYAFDQQPATVTLTLQDTWIDGLFYWDTSDLDGPDFYGP